MSDSILIKHLRKPKTVAERTLEYTPIVISDSKGRYLKEQVEASEYPENAIVWFD